MLVAALGIATLTAQSITTESLLAEMEDRNRLADFPSPAYRTAQASSFDRASLSPGTEAWFANADFGKFLRTETTEGRTEMVMADLQGPGAVVRIWSANPLGTIRFYFDGENAPRLEAPMADLLSGKVDPYKSPFAYVAARGCNLYFPFPYSKSLKITVEDPSGQNAKGLYYHVGFRTYDPRVNAVTWQPTAVEFSETAKAGSAAESRGLTWKGSVGQDMKLAPGESDALTLESGKPAAISELALDVTLSKDELPFTDPKNPAQILRHLLLELTFDGQTTVRVPASDFFGAAPAPVDTRSTLMTATSLSTRGASLKSRWIMPFLGKAEVRIVNRGKETVELHVGVVSRGRPATERTMVFHSEWRYHGVGTRPMVDMTAMDFVGQGRFVGLGLHVANRTPAWWGEGDEKIYVDGETFPSTFGTGTEDYFGYAWCDPTPFAMPYHAQTVVGTPGNFGQTTNLRWHVNDDIPFAKSLKFDLEKWHWQDAETSFATTAYWYAKPSKHAAREIATADLSPLETSPPKPVEGALEGETLPLLEVKGGTTERQGGYWELSNGEQLWWKDARVGDKLRIEVSVPKTGKYKISGNFCHAQDYGRHRLSIAGQSLGEKDFYGTGVTWKALELGEVTLTAGKHEFVVEVVGSNPLAEPKRHMFGLDYLLLVPTG